MADAVIVCPDGKENASGGRTRKRGWGARSQGRGRRNRRFSKVKSTTDERPAATPATSASWPRSPQTTSSGASASHPQPSPKRVATTIHAQSQRGGVQSWTRAQALRSDSLKNDKSAF